MDQSNIYAELTTAFQDVFEDDGIVLSADTTASDVDGWDSFAHIRLILTVEKMFNIKFSAAEVANMKNVGQLVDMIGAKG